MKNFKDTLLQELEKRIINLLLSDKEITYESPYTNSDGSYGVQLVKINVINDIVSRIYEQVKENLIERLVPLVEEKLSKKIRDKELKNLTEMVKKKIQDEVDVSTKGYYEAEISIAVNKMIEEKKGIIQTKIKEAVEKHRKEIEKKCGELGNKLEIQVNTEVKFSLKDS